MYLLEIEASSSHPWEEKGCHLLIQGTLIEKPRFIQEQLYTGWLSRCCGPLSFRNRNCWNSSLFMMCLCVWRLSREQRPRGGVCVCVCACEGSPESRGLGGGMCVCVCACEGSPESRGLGVGCVCVWVWRLSGEQRPGVCVCVCVCVRRLSGEQRPGGWGEGCVCHGNPWIASQVRQKCG